MDNALVIAAISGTLKSLFERYFVERSTPLDLSEFEVTCKPLDRLASANGVRHAGLNIFLYQLAPNFFHKALPDRPEHLVGTSLIPVDLYYILTAQSERDFETELILGTAMQCMNEHSVWGPDLIAKYNPIAAFDPSSIRQEVRFTIKTLAISEMSQLWRMCQTGYRPSLTYEASGILV